MSYDLLKDFGDDPDHAESNPHWILHVIRYAQPLTSSRQRIAARTEFSDNDISFDDLDDTLTATRDPLTISKSCLSLSVSSTKANYIQQLQAVLAPRYNFLSAIMPGDWILAWMVQSKAAYQRVRRALRGLDVSAPASSWKDLVDQSIREEKAGAFSVNDFDSGLKFVGQVRDVRKVFAQAPTGMRYVRYNLSASGFNPLDSAVIFEPGLSRNEQYIEKFMANLGIALKEIFNESATDSNKGGIEVNKMLPLLLNVLVGKGLEGIGIASAGLKLAYGAGAVDDAARYAYPIPAELAHLLGVRQPSKPVYSYADILESIVGLQKYTNYRSQELSQEMSQFFPDGAELVTISPRHTTAHPLLGTYLPMPTAFNGKTVWSLMREYSNPALNEMYTAVRVTPNKKIMPTLVARQLPFSSPPVVDKVGSDQATSYWELPRWHVSPVLVSSYDLGRSDALRVNYVHIVAQPTKQTLITTSATQAVLFPPVADAQDIKRNGLRHYTGQSPTSSVEIEGGGPRFTMDILSDFLMGGHLTLTGTMVLRGIPAPIAVGDNVEFDDTIYHIESVVHTAKIEGQGKKSFTTSLSLSHGMRADINKALSGMGVAAVIKKDRLNWKAQQYLDAAGPDSVVPPATFRGLSKSDAEAQRAKIAANYGLVQERNNGIAVLELESNLKNPDILYYQGIQLGDNTGYDPGFTFEDEDDDDGSV